MSGRRIKSDYEESSLDLPMTPMIDVIFQLMIFFMCSINFKSLEGKLYSYLPKDKGGTEGPAFLYPEVRVNLIYNKTKPPLMTDIRIGQNPVRDWDELYSQVGVLWKDIQAQATKPEDIKPFKIAAQGQVPAQSVVNTLDALKRAGVAKIEFAVASPPK